MARRFADRVDAGQQLGDVLAQKGYPDNIVVLGLPRGGVPVAYEVAKRLGASLDIIVVRKIGVPGHRELAMGAVASGGTVIENRDVIDWLGIDEETFGRGTHLAFEELKQRESRLRGSRPSTDVAAKTAILVDDGIATGSTMRAAVEALRSQHPDRIVVAVPVSSPEAVRDLQGTADEVVALITPRSLGAVGLWYRDFGQTQDEEVRRLIEDASPS